MELDERLASGERGRHDAPVAAAAATAAGHACLGWPEAGRIEAGALADLVTIGLGGVRLAGTTPATRTRRGGVRRRRGRRRARGLRRAGRSSATARTSASTWPRELREAIAAVTTMTPRSIDRIGLLVTNDPELGEGPLGIVRDAALVIEGGRVAAIEPAGAAADERFDAAGRCVIPGFVDSHTHLVFAGDRGEEFAARMAGEPYAAGGIQVTTEATRAASEAELLRARAGAPGRGHRAPASRRSRSSRATGSRSSPRRGCCRVAAELTDEVTFLGAHLLPPEYEGRADEYVELVCGPMLDACRPYARWIDVFCERGAFDADQSRAMLDAGRGGRARPARARQPARPGAGGAARRRARRRLGRPLHLPLRRRRRRARGERHGRHVPAGDRLLDPPALPRRAPRDRRRGRPSRSPPTPTRARATRPRCRSASRWPCATWG